MKKRMICALGLSFAAALALTGCSSSTYGKYIKLGSYKGLEVSKIKSEVTDESLEEELQYILDDNTEYTEVDRAAKNNDMVNIDYTAQKDGEDFEGNSEEDLDIALGEGYLEGYFLEEAEDDLIGMKAGDTKEVTVTLADDYFDEELAGSKLTISITMNTVSEINRPELTDEFVASISDFDTVDAYKEDLRENLLVSMEENNEYSAGSDALQQVIENSKISGYPEELYEENLTLYNESNAAYAEMLGLDVADFALSEEETKEVVESMVYEQMVITEIAEKEKLSVTEEEYTSYVESMLDDYEVSSIEEFESYYSKESTMDELLRSKVQTFLLDHATVTEVSEEEYYGAYEDEVTEEEDVIELDMDEEETAEEETATESVTEE